VGDKYLSPSPLSLSLSLFLRHTSSRHPLPAPPPVPLFLAFFLPLGLGFCDGSLRPGTTNRWERRPSPPLALWAVDLIRFCLSGVGFWFSLPLLFLRRNFRCWSLGCSWRREQCRSRRSGPWRRASRQQPAAVRGREATTQASDQHQAKYQLVLAQGTDEHILVQLQIQGEHR